MDDPRMELPPPEELGEWLRATRSEHGVTQTELADRLDVSPSQISRIESRQGGARYETLYRVQQELLTLIDSESTTNVRDVLARKHDFRPPVYELVSVAPTESVETAIEQMEDLNISQLPVIDQSGQSVGRLTERYLLEVTDLTTDVRQHMRTPFPEIPADAPATLARDLLDTNEAVLITPGQTNLSKTEENPYVGVLTPADFARIEQL